VLLLAAASLVWMVLPAAAQTLAERERNCAIQKEGLRAGRNARLGACVNLGWYLHLQGRDREAIAVLAEAARLDPTDEKAFNALGVVYLFTGEYPRALAANRAAIRLKPDNAIAHYNLSLAQWELGQFAEAVRSAERATRLEPENPHPWVALAIAHRRAGDDARAVAAYRRAVALDRRYRSAAHLEKLRRSDFSPRQIRVARDVLSASRAGR
jgi:Flp pilus assembly protein TadD